MGAMKFGNIEINPAKNPAVLDTATWDAAHAWRVVCSLGESYWQSVYEGIEEGKPLPADKNCIAYGGSGTQYRGRVFLLVGLGDGQHVFVEVGRDQSDTVLGEPVSAKRLEDGSQVVMYNTDACTIERYIRLVKPEKAPKALGATPRLGIGSRMSTAVWRGVWQAMDKCGLAANAIQNSMREVNVLEDVLAGQPARANYQFGFGTIEEGHTGSTFEGLWVAGVLEALKTDTHPTFGADADHIMVKRGVEGIDRAKRVIEAARYYTFFTLDVSDILDYGAMSTASDGAAKALLTDKIEQVEDRRAVLAYHSQKRRIGGQDYEPDETTIARLVGKYWAALDAVVQLCHHIEGVKSGAAFDLELSIDENPPSVGTFDCLTRGVELIFLIHEMRRRQIRLSHIAPNFGIEKGRDYRGADGLVGLEQRIRGLHQIAAECGVMLDCHSGDDLSSASRQAVGRATNGEIHFKISPALQVLFAEVLNELEPEQFRVWWDDTIAYARREAAGGSDFAADCIRQYETSSDPEPSPRHAVFHHFCFASVGRRDTNGQFINRERFYDLSADFYREYQSRVASYLCDVAKDVFNQT